MAQPQSVLTYVARITRAEKTAMFNHTAAFNATALQVILLDAIEEVCLDRLIRADGCLRLAKLLQLDTNEEAQRAAVGRAYYSIHHSIRTMALWQNKWDPDGHEESIKEFKKLLSDSSCAHRSGLTVDISERIVTARANRHVADYSPYDEQRDPPDISAVGITGVSWPNAVVFNINVAEQVLTGATKFIGS